MGPTERVESGVIAYNGDSERGWNDPPTLSFVGASKKASKLDLRKRVSHQEALTGRKITSPSNQNTSNLYNQSNHISNGLSSPILAQQPVCQPVKSGVSPTISPCHSRHSSGSFTPPLPTEYPSPTITAQVPSQYPVQSLVSSQSSSLDLSSKKYVLHGQIPLVTSVQATRTAPPKISSPVSTAPPPILGQPLFSFPKSFNMAPVSKALDSSHVRSHPDLVLDSSPDSQNSLNGNQPSKNILANFPSEAVPPPLIFTPSPTSTNSFTPSPNDVIRKSSPVLNRTYKSNSVPSLYTSPPTGNKSPVSTPTGVHSAGNTPRSASPACGCRSNEAGQDINETFDSQEVMKVTVEALEETILKCSNILKNREVEDVKKKLAIMKQQWQDEKLSMQVKITMKLLAKALLDVDTQTAHSLHLHLMVDYVGEVKQWMVAIKRLISAIGNLHIMHSTPAS